MTSGEPLPDELLRDAETALRLIENLLAELRGDAPARVDPAAPPALELQPASRFRLVRRRLVQAYEDVVAIQDGLTSSSAAAGEDPQDEGASAPGSATETLIQNVLWQIAYTLTLLDGFEAGGPPG